MYLKMCGKWRPFCIGRNVLRSSCHCFNGKHSQVICCQRIALRCYLSEKYMTNCLYISSCVSHNRDRGRICYRIAECYLPPSYWLTIYWWLIRHNRNKIHQLLIKHWWIFVVGCRYHPNRTQLAKTKLVKYGRIYRESPGNHVPDFIHVKYNNTFVILTYHRQRCVSKYRHLNLLTQATQSLLGNPWQTLDP